ncbi:MAG: thiol-disulfide oxidoreductase DCC family protein [Parasphingorhabdus sp.]|uniref:thiol-disulfide oxidoreductase DCC family protein n=1 Tax=Parasphingorhabdus sp. TaxID=2709688 RepID=UPI003299710B
MQDNIEQPLSAGQAIIVFDAECILCSANAQFLLKHDHQRRFLLASMQGEYGSALYRKHDIDPTNPETLIVVQGDDLLRNSDAVLAIYAGLGWPWKTVAAAKVLPKLLRDPVYLFIARNRYRVFGKRDTCWLPDPEFRDRML